VQVGHEFPALLLGQFGHRRRVERPHHLLHQMQRELASLAGFLHLLVVQLFLRNLHQFMIGQIPADHQAVKRLRSVIACQFIHGPDVAHPAAGG